MPGCPMCYRQFSSVRRYKRHVLRHGLGQPATPAATPPEDPVSHGTPQQVICDKGLSPQSTLMPYGLRHKPFKCSFCPSWFSQMAKLLDHEREHTDEKPFCCDVCGKRLKSLQSLNTHRKTHLEVKDFQCSLCSAGFVPRTSLMTHLERHHSAQLPFCCPRCRWGSDCGFCTRCGDPQSDHQADVSVVDRRAETGPYDDVSSRRTLASGGSGVICSNCGMRLLTPASQEKTLAEPHQAA